MTALQISPRDRSTASHPHSETLLAVREKAAFLDTNGLLALVLKEIFPGRIAVLSSFAAESAILLHHVAKIDPTTPVLFLNTGKLFGETLRYRDRLQDDLGLTDIRSIGPHPLDRDRTDPGGTLWSRNPDACCEFRKVIPLSRASAGFAAIVTGRKKFQTTTRAAMERIELADGAFRINPFAEWSPEDIEAYIAREKLPRHPLSLDGYPSIGCLPCTRRVRPDEGYRDGRWAGFEKDECGIHAGIDGEGI